MPNLKFGQKRAYSAGQRRRGGGSIKKRPVRGYRGGGRVRRTPRRVR